MDFKTPLAKVRGLGSAKEGVSHWWLQRLTAVALVPLVFWLVFSLVSLAPADQLVVQAWLAQPFNAVLMIVLMVALLWHGQLGLQVVVEDYIANRSVEVVLQVLIKFAAIILAVASVLSVLKIALGA